MPKLSGKIGIFDSGLGGLVIAKAIFKALPNYSYVYLGDTAFVPYGEKTPKQIYQRTEKAVDFLFKQGCELIIVACNTSSAVALRKIQQKYLPAHYPNRRVLGVVIPTLEVAGERRHSGSLGVLSTTATAKAHIYKKELKKISPKLKIYEATAPALVPMIEGNKISEIDDKLQGYLKLLTKHKIYAIILACTHYPLLKQKISQTLGKNVKIISQDEIIPGKLALYLQKHKEIKNLIGQEKKRVFYLTKITPEFKIVAGRLFGKKLLFKKTNI